MIRISVVLTIVILCFCLTETLGSEGEDDPFCGFVDCSHAKAEKYCPVKCAGDPEYCEAVDCSLPNSDTWCPFKCAPDAQDPEVCEVVDCSMSNSETLCPYKCALVSSNPKWVSYNRSPGCQTDFITTKEECLEAGRFLGYTGNLVEGTWSLRPPGCSASPESGSIFFNLNALGKTGDANMNSICLSQGTAQIPEDYALTIPGCTEEDNILYWGNDFNWPYGTRVFPNGTVSDCANWCGEVEQCKYWTFSKSENRCHLKEAIGSKHRINPDRVSGSKGCSAVPSALALEKEYYNIEGFRCTDECKLDELARIYRCNPLNATITTYCSPDSMTTYQNHVCEDKCSKSFGKYYTCSITKANGQLYQMPCSPHPDPSV